MRVRSPARSLYRSSSTERAALQRSNVQLSVVIHPAPSILRLPPSRLGNSLAFLRLSFPVFSNRLVGSLIPCLSPGDYSTLAVRKSNDGCTLFRVPRFSSTIPHTFFRPPSSVLFHPSSFIPHPRIICLWERGIPEIMTLHSGRVRRAVLIILVAPSGDFKTKTVAHAERHFQLACCSRAVRAPPEF